MDDEFKNLTALVEDVKRAKEAHELLLRVWLEVGPYHEGEISSETWDKVRRYFKFDDSE